MFCSRVGHLLAYNPSSSLSLFGRYNNTVAQCSMYVVVYWWEVGCVFAQTVLGYVRHVTGTTHQRCARHRYIFLYFRRQLPKYHWSHEVKAHYVRRRRSNGRKNVLWVLLVLMRDFCTETASVQYPTVGWVIYLEAAANLDNRRANSSLKGWPLIIIIFVTN